MKNDSIYETIKNRIISLDLAPGTKLREEDLAAEFGVSRTPVRSIIARLVQEGLLDVVPQKGTFISRISREGLMDCLHMRKAVELFAIREAAEKIDGFGLALLNEILDEQEEIAKRSPSLEKSRDFYDNDSRFHKTIFAIAKLESLWDLLDSVVTPFNRARIMSNLRESGRTITVCNQHRKIAEMLALKDKEGAYSAYEEHLDQALDGLAPVIEQYKDYFILGDHE